MNEQIILLIFLVAALAVTLGLYFLKAKKQIQYKGDERWKLIQLNANNAANISNAVNISRYEGHRYTFEIHQYT